MARTNDMVGKPIGMVYQMRPEEKTAYIWMRELGLSWAETARLGAHSAPKVKRELLDTYPELDGYRERSSEAVQIRRSNLGENLMSLRDGGRTVGELVTEYGLSADTIMHARVLRKRKWMMAHPVEMVQEGRRVGRSDTATAAMMGITLDSLMMHVSEELLAGEDSPEEADLQPELGLEESSGDNSLEDLQTTVANMNETLREMSGQLRGEFRDLRDRVGSLERARTRLETVSGEFLDQLTRSL